MERTNKIVKLLENREFLIIAHRGVWGGNVIQNTIQSADLAQRSGADVCEIDIRRSSDGVYFVFHNGFEPDILHRQEDLSEMTAEDIRQAPTYSVYGGESGFHINSLEEMLDWLPEDFYLNIDRSWFYWDDPALFDLIQSSGKADQVFIKSRVRESNLPQLDNLNRADSGLNFVAIIESQAEYRYVEGLEGIKLIGAELVGERADQDIFDKNFLYGLKDQGQLVVANAEVLGVETVMHRGLDDDVALFEGYDKGWGGMLDDGCNAIITHWTSFLNDYREVRSCQA